jgi:hypothetical protein
MRSSPHRVGPGATPDCSPDPIAAAPHGSDVEGVLHADRDPVNELYDRGCDLVEAAGAIRRAASAAEGARAAPAVLGCIEAALGHLIDAAAAMDSAADHAARPATTRSGDARDEVARDRMRRGFVNLEHGLRDARLLAGAARALAARALARADLGEPGRRAGRESDARPAHRPVGPLADAAASTSRRRRGRP